MSTQGNDNSSKLLSILEPWLTRFSAGTADEVRSLIDKNATQEELRQICDLSIRLLEDGGRNLLAISEFCENLPDREVASRISSFILAILPAEGGNQ